MDIVRIPITDDLAAAIEAAKAGDQVLIVRDGRPVAEVRPIAAVEPPRDLFSPEFRERAKALRARLGIGDVSAADLICEMRDEGY